MTPSRPDPSDGTDDSATELSASEPSASEPAGPLLPDEAPNESDLPGPAHTKVTRHGTAAAGTPTATIMD